MHWTGAPRCRRTHARIQLTERGATLTTLKAIIASTRTEDALDHDTNASCYAKALTSWLCASRKQHGPRGLLATTVRAHFVRTSCWTTPPAPALLPMKWRPATRATTGDATRHPPEIGAPQTKRRKESTRQKRTGQDESRQTNTRQDETRKEKEGMERTGKEMKGAAEGHPE